MKVESRPLFAASCKHALSIVGNRPSIAEFFLEPQDVQYLLQEMAFKTQSRKRIKSFSNLLDVNNKTKKDEGEEEYRQEDLKRTQTSTLRGGRINNRVFSQMDLLQPRIITEK